VDSDGEKKILQRRSLNQIRRERWTMMRGFVVALAVLLLLLPLAWGIELGISRNVGTNLGQKIKGKFTAKARQIEGATKVEFYLDEELVMTSTEEPHRWTFRTEEYPEGVHTIKAVAYFPDGRVEEDSLQREFISSLGGWWGLYLGGMIALVAGISLFSIWVTNRERKQPQGKTTCPKCGSTFDRKWSPFHKGAAYRNTCPMCNNTFWADRLPEGDAA
jgi:hypothetical protein